MSRSAMIPVCVGTYEANEPACDGEADAENEDDRRPCSWRERCRGFARRLEATGASATDFVEIRKTTASVRRRTGWSTVGVPVGRTVEEFSAYCLDNEDASSESPAPPKPRRPKKKAKRESAQEAKPEKPKRPKIPARLRPVRSPHGKAHRTRSRARCKELRSLAYRIIRVAKKRWSPRRVHVVPKMVPVFPGDFYVVDRSKASRYVIVKVRVPKGNDRGVVYFKFRPGFMRLDIGVAVPLRQFESLCKPEEVARLSPMPLKDGLFQTMIRAADNDRALELIDVLARALKRKEVDFNGDD